MNSSTLVTYHSPSLSATRTDVANALPSIKALIIGLWRLPVYKLCRRTSFNICHLETSHFRNAQVPDLRRVSSGSSPLISPTHAVSGGSSPNHTIDVTAVIAVKDFLPIIFSIG